MLVASAEASKLKRRTRRKGGKAERRKGGKAERRKGGKAERRKGGKAERRRWPLATPISGRTFHHPWRVCYPQGSGMQLCPMKSMIDCICQRIRTRDELYLYSVFIPLKHPASFPYSLSLSHICPAPYPRASRITMPLLAQGQPECP